MGINEAKTIAIFSGYYSPHIGGVERYVESLSKELTTRGHKVIVVTTRHNSSLSTFEQRTEADVYRLPIHSFFKSRYPIPIINKEYKSIVRQIKRLEPDAVVLNTRFHLTSLVGARVAKRLRVKSILIEHGSSHYSIGNRVLDLLGKGYEHLLTNYLKKYVKDFYGVSKDCNRWLEHYRIKSKGVLYNAVDAGISRGVKDVFHARKNSKDVVIVFAGRLLFEKGLRELISAIGIIDRERRDYKLLIAGDGPLLDEVGSFAANHNKVEYLGRLNRQEMMSLYKSADIFVHPSWTEGMPTSVLEAAVFANSIIATPAGGTKEVINDGVTGSIVPFKNSRKLAEVIISHIQDRALRERLGKNAKQLVIKEFTWEKTADNLLRAISVN